MRTRSSRFASSKTANRWRDSRSPQSVEGARPRSGHPIRGDIEIAADAVPYTSGDGIAVWFARCEAGEIELSFWPDLDDEICDREAECDGLLIAVTFRGFSTFRPRVLRGFDLGGDLGYTPFGASRQSLVNQATAEIHRDVLTAFLDYSTPVGERIWLSSAVGVAGIWNRTDASVDALVDGLRLQIGHMPGDAQDADRHTFVGIEAFHLFGTQDHMP